MRKLILLAALVAMPLIANAQAGDCFIHDPSNIMVSNGKYYTFGTGTNGISSADGWNWVRDAIRPHPGAAPDALKIGDRYLIAWSSTGGGLGGGHAGRILTCWNKTLDPKDPNFEYSEPIEVAFSYEDEDADTIDAGLLMGPDGRLWVTFGTYFGAIRVVELDPETGARKEGAMEKDIAIDCEATTMIYRNGYYYLLGTHGTCCDGVNSTYNIIVGRSKSPMGPFIDNVGRDMLRGGGKMVIAAYGPYIGAGHFGLYKEDCGVDKFSLHYEADRNRSGKSILAIRPLIWVNDWPVGVESFEGGTFGIISERRGYALELSVDFVRMQGRMRGGFGFGRAATNEPEVVIENQKLEDVIETWPKGETAIRIGDYMIRPHQRWSFVPVPEAGGYLTSPYFKVVIEGTERALTATADKEVISQEYTGCDAQLWRVETLTDGTYRIMPKAVPGHENEKLVLVSVADSTPALGAWDFNSDNCKWHFSAR